LLLTARADGDPAKLTLPAASVAAVYLIARVVIYSARADAKNHRAAARAGADPCVDKPRFGHPATIIKDLLRRVRRALPLINSRRGDPRIYSRRPASRGGVTRGGRR
jgi:hypothetical protein